MALRDYIPERRIVERGGRRFICRKPTVAGVYLLLSRFASVLLSAARAYRQTTDLGTDPVATLLPFFMRAPEEAAEVLETCIDDLGPGELATMFEADPALAEALVKAILSLCNAERIVESLRLDAALDVVEDDPDAAEVAEDGPSPHDLLLALMSARYHCSPLAIIGWPYEAFLSLSEQMVPGDKQPALASAEEIEDAFGVHVVRVPKEEAH